MIFCKVIKTSLSFSVRYLCELEFSSHMSIKTTSCNRLNAGADMRIQLFSIKPNTKEIFKTVKQCYSSG